MLRRVTDLNICLSIILIGYILQYTLPPLNIQAFAAPLNIVLLILFALIIIYLYTLTPQHPTLRRLMGRKMSFALILSYALMLLLVGFIPQDRFLQSVTEGGWMRRMGLYDVVHSYPFILINLALLLSLGMVSIKHLRHFTLRGVTLSLGHIGLWLLLSSGLFGAGSLREYRVAVEEGQRGRMAINAEGQMEPLPFEVKLEGFSVEHYPSGAPRSYCSSVELLDNHAQVVKSGEILVNSPMVHSGYYIYQSGFDPPTKSIFRVVYDPWLYIAKSGIYMLIGAAILMIFLSVERRDVE